MLVAGCFQECQNNPTACLRAVSDDLWGCVRFFHRLSEKKKRETAMDDTSGIPLRSDLSFFRKLCPTSAGRVTLTQPGLGATAMIEF